MKSPTIVITGPSGAGKTLHAENLRKGFGCSSIVDEWTPDMPMTPGALHITNHEISRDAVGHDAWICHWGEGDEK